MLLDVACALQQLCLTGFSTDGQVTVDWVMNGSPLTTSEHTFTNGGGYHEIGFRLDSGTYFNPL